jgi:predicted ATPase/DNA-binding SARP family transcriptional activator
MTNLSLCLLGPPRIDVDGTPIDVDTRKAIALLAYLSVTRQPYTRDGLASLLWPEYDQTHARATLRRTLSTLNKALAGDWLEVSRETIRLRSGPDLYIDVDHFHTLINECRAHGHGPSEVCSSCLRPLAEAADLYRADFLMGFGLKDSWDFDEWQQFQTEGLRRDLATVLERLVYGHAALQEFDAAISYARRWLTLDRLHEPAHRWLMQLSAWAGQRTAALQHYRECVQVLEQELGVAPLESTTQLYGAIKEQRTPPLPILSEGSKFKVQSSKQLSHFEPSTLNFEPVSPAVHKSVPLVGRLAEWQQLLRIWDGIGPHGQVIIVQGEAGIGKTRLAEELLDFADAGGSTILVARCYEGEADLAYGPVVSALRAALDQMGSASWQAKVPPAWLAEVARLLPEVAVGRSDLLSVPPLDSPGAQSRFFESIRQLLLAAGGGEKPGRHTGRVLLLFDDLHWADQASLDLLSYLVRRLHDWPVCLILTWRSDHSSGEDHLHHLLSVAQRSPQATVLSPTRLNKADIGEMVRSVSDPGAALSPALAERLYQETEGLPFFLVEYLNALEHSPQTAGAEEWSLPLGVRDLLRSRLREVSETGRQLLHAAAVIGRSFDFDTLHQASGRSEEEAVTALEELIALGIVAEMRGGNSAQTLTYDFSHEKLRGLVYEETSLARRRLLHRRVAEALAGRSRGHNEAGSLAGQIAHHYRLAGNEEAAAEHYRLAGEHARRLYANTEALAHLQTALAFGHPDVAGLHEVVGDVHTLLGEYGAALASYERAASSLIHDDASRKTLSRLEHKLSNVYVRRGEWEPAESHFEAALIGCGEAEAANDCARIYADWCLAAHHQGQTDRARELAQRALQLAEAAGEPRALAQTHNILGIIASRNGDHEAARHHLEQTLALTETLDEPSIRAAALNNLALVYGANGQVEEALQVGEEALALVASQGDRHREAAVHNNLADLLHAADRSEEAMLHLKQSVAIYAEIGVEAGALQPAIWRLVEW